MTHLAIGTLAHLWGRGWLVAHPDRTPFSAQCPDWTDPPAIGKHVEEERVILTPSEHEALASAYADSSTE
jgi:hypothetical protein